MESNQNQLAYYQRQFDEKMQKKLDLQLLGNLINKVADKEDMKITELLNAMFVELDLIRKDLKMKRKKYFTLFSELKKHVKNTYGFVPKGSVQSEYMAMGVAFGVAFGAAFTTINAAFIGIGIPIGIAIGIGIGTNKEKALEQENKLY